MEISRDDEVEMEQNTIDEDKQDKRDSKFGPKLQLNSVIVKDLNYDIVKKEGSLFKKKKVTKSILTGVNLNLKLNSLTAILGDYFSQIFVFLFSQKVCTTRSERSGEGLFQFQRNECKKDIFRLFLLKFAKKDDAVELHCPARYGRLSC